MDEKIRITLSSTDENLATLYPNKTDTVRSVLKSAKIVSPPNSQIICFLKKLINSFQTSTNKKLKIIKK